MAFAERSDFDKNPAGGLASIRSTKSTSGCDRKHDAVEHGDRREPRLFS
jgi:hypothetical protein